MISVTRQALPGFGRFHVFFALVMRDMDYRFREHRLGAIIYTFEPVALIFFMSAMRTTLLNYQPPFGPSILLFYATGHFPYYFFLRCSKGVGRMRFRSEFPMVSDFDVLISRYIIEALRMGAVSLVFMGGLYIYGIDEAAPTSLGVCCVAVLMLGLFALGIGMINSGIKSHFPIWGIMYQVMSRGALLLSRALYVVDRIPVYPRSFVVWNPIAHALESLRTGFYPDYPVRSLDLNYFFVATASSMIVGFIVFSNRAQR